MPYLHEEEISSPFSYKSIGPCKTSFRLGVCKVWVFVHKHPSECGASRLPGPAYFFLGCICGHQEQVVRLPYYGRMEKGMAGLPPGGLRTGLANNYRLPRLPRGEELWCSFPSSFWLDTHNMNEHLAGPAGLHKLQGLTPEAEANIHSFQCKTKEFLVTQQHFTFSFVFQSHRKSPKSHQRNYTSRKACS